MNADKTPRDQIVFDQPEKAESPTVLDEQITGQILFDQQQNWLPETTETEHIAPPEPVFAKSNPIKSGLLKVAGVAFAGVLTIEAIDFFSQGFSQAPVSTSLWAVVLGVVGSLGIAALVKEFRGLATLNRQQQSADQALALLTDNDKPESQRSGELVTICEQITENLPEDLQQALEQHWLAQDKSLLSPSDVAQLYSETVLIKVDEQVMADIARYSTEAAVMVAVSPVAIVDMLLLMWRNLKMIDRVAALYGVKLGYWGRVKLLRSVFANMVYAGASEMIADVGLDALGVDALGKVSGRFAQGIGAGMLTARLGIKALHLCRPLPVQASEQAVKRLNSGQVRKAMLSQVKRLVSQSENPQSGGK